MAKESHNGSGRAKRIEQYYHSIRYRNDPQPKSPNLRIEITLSRIQQVSEVIQALSDRQLFGKVSLNIRPSVSQQKSSQSPVMTSHTCYVHRLADNTLQCRVCGQKLPSTRQGGLDKARLAREMCLRTWSCRHQ